MTSASNTISTSLSIFGGENYDYWGIKIKAFLKANALLEVVGNGPQKQQEGVRPTEESLKNINEDELKDAKALSFMLNAVTETIFPKIMRASTAKEAWDSLQKEFHGEERLRAIRLSTLRKDFGNLKMRENEDIQAYTSRVTEIVNQMKICEEQVGMNVKSKLHRLGCCNDDLCTICQRESETIEHLFDHCQYTTIVLSHLLQWFGGQNPTVQTLSAGRNNKWKVRVALFNACHYHIWNQRNKARLEDSLIRPEKIAEQIEKEVRTRVKSKLKAEKDQLTLSWFAIGNH